jgi:hypothetical protein
MPYRQVTAIAEDSAHALGLVVNVVDGRFHFVKRPSAAWANSPLAQHVLFIPFRRQPVLVLEIRRPKLSFPPLLLREIGHPDASYKPYTAFP